MDKYFSIGEIAKLHNISVETLRHYDRSGLLKPEYINEKTGYRYYSMKSFMKIDLIKHCKAIGLSLEEIKCIMKDYTSLESILKILTNQKDIIDSKITQLSNIKESIETLENNIKASLNTGINKVFVKHNPKRNMIKYNYVGRYTEEFEINLRKSLLEIEEKYNTFNSQIVFATSYANLINNNELTYIKTMIKINDDDLNEDETVITLPEGNYITLYFDDNYYHTRIYYDILVDYIKNNNIEVVGDFHEMYIMTRAGNDDKTKSLAQIEILLKE